MKANPINLMRTLLTKSRITRERICGNVAATVFLHNYLTNEMKCENVLKECISNLEATLVKVVRWLFLGLRFGQLWEWTRERTMIWTMAVALSIAKCSLSPKPKQHTKVRCRKSVKHSVPKHGPIIRPINYTKTALRKGKYS